MARREPQNLDAEISVLGCGFLERSALDKLMDEVNEDMFYSKANRIIYKAMKELHSMASTNIMMSNTIQTPKSTFFYKASTKL